MSSLKEYLQSTGALVEAFAETLPTPYLKPKEIADGALMYFRRGGKRLRPALVRLFAGAYGGKEKEAAALPAACASELFHNWTLIHDDIIDNDRTRRGGPSVHAYAADSFAKIAHKTNAAEYGIDAAILAGDALHAMSTRALTYLPQYGVDPAIALKLIQMMDGETVDHLICGETLDTRFGLIPLPVTEEDAIEMILGKTGALFAFCSRAGAMIGLNTADERDPRVEAAARFSFDCGLAFQLQDDVLGILSDEKTLGKPVGSDIREGKHTPIRQYAETHATPAQKQILARAMGNREASPDQIEAAKKVLVESGGVDHAKAMAEEAISRARSALEEIPENEYKEMIRAWADMMLRRNH